MRVSGEGLIFFTHGPFLNCSYVMFLNVILINRIVDFELWCSLKILGFDIVNTDVKSSSILLKWCNPLTYCSRSANNPFCSSADCNSLKLENVLQQQWSNSRRVNLSTGPMNRFNCSQKFWKVRIVKFPQYQLNPFLILQFRFLKVAC